MLRNSLKEAMTEVLCDKKPKIWKQCRPRLRLVLLRIFRALRRQPLPSPPSVMTAVVDTRRPRILKSLLYAGEPVSSSRWFSASMVRSDMFAYLFDRENSRYRIVSTQGVLKLLKNRGQLWRTFLVSNCVYFSIHALSLLKKNKEENTVTYQESPPWLLTMFKTPCVETILYPEFSRSNRQANISGRAMDAGNHRLLLTSSPAYYTFLETTENYTLQIQRENQVCSPRPRVSTRPRVPVPLLVTANI